MSQEVKTSAEAKKMIAQIDRQFADLANIRITCPDDYEQIGREFKETREKVKLLTEIRMGMTKPIDLAKERIIEFFKIPLDRAAEIQGRRNQVMTAYKLELDRKRREEEEKLRRQAEEKERAERERLRKEAEEKERAAEEARLKAEKAASHGKHQTAQKLVEQSEALMQESKEIRQESRQVEVEVKSARTPTAKVEGLGIRENWSFRILDVNKIPRGLMIPDEKRLGEIARREKDKAVVSGVEFYVTRSHV